MSIPPVGCAGFALHWTTVSIPCSTSTSTTTCWKRGSTLESKASWMIHLCCTAFRRAGWPATRNTARMPWQSAGSTTSPQTWLIWWQLRMPRRWPAIRTTGQGCTSTRCSPMTWRSNGPKRLTNCRVRWELGGDKEIKSLIGTANVPTHLSLYG